MSTALDLVKDSTTTVGDIIEKTKDFNPVNDGITCTHCGVKEVFKNSEDPHNHHLWYWMIGAYKVDDKSKCYNCGQWF